MGGVGGVTGKVPRGSGEKAFAWWRSGCLGWSLGGLQDRGCLGRKQRSVIMRGGCREETKASSIATGGHACRSDRIGQPKDHNLLGQSCRACAAASPLTHGNHSRRLIVGAGLKPASTASTLGREAFA
jgi:hypothetical protein